MSTVTMCSDVSFTQYSLPPMVAVPAGAWRLNAVPAVAYVPDETSKGVFSVNVHLQDPLPVQLADWIPIWPTRADCSSTVSAAQDCPARQVSGMLTTAVAFMVRFD